MRIGFAHDLRIVDFYLRELEGKRGEGKCHAMVLVGVDRFETRLAGLYTSDSAQIPISELLEPP